MNEFENEKNNFEGTENDRNVSGFSDNDVNESDNSQTVLSDDLSANYQSEDVSSYKEPIEEFNRESTVESYEDPLSVENSDTVNEPYPDTSYSFGENVNISNSDTPLYDTENHVGEQNDIQNIAVDEQTDIKTGEFYTTKTKPYKKKKYMSVKAAVVALIITAIVSISGGAFLSGVVYKSRMSGGANGGNMVSVQDNINLSKENSGKSGQSAGNATAGDSLSIPEIVDKVGPAVVGIINKTTYGNAYGFYGSLYGNLDDEIEQSSGSGVVISSDGYIVTNNHVIENATALTVILNTGKEYEAKIVGRDASTDLAVIKIEADNLIFAQMGNSSDLRVGEIAVAIGNPLGQEFAGTTTQGIISGLNRSVTVEDKTMNLIQTDAAINPGNSGGALVNQYGHLIGINTVKISSNTLEGLGFAIPIDEAKPIIKELMTNGYVTGRPVIGIAGRAVTEDDAKAYNMKVGVYVSSMTPNGPAYMSGVKIGDIIVECEGEPIETVDDINEIKNRKRPGDEINIKVYRKGNYVDLIIILGEESPAE